MPERKEIVFIINPRSGSRKKKNLQFKIESFIDQNKYCPVFELTKYAGHATNIVKQYIQKGTKYFVAVGGDGTVNEVASALVSTGAVMGIVPAGSGNGLARSLKIPMNTVKAIQCINNGNCLNIDAGSINERYFFCTCGSGFDAKIGHQFAKSEKRGFFSYIKTTLKEFHNYKPRKFRLKIDGKKMKRKAFLITVANAGQYGNNAYIAPQSKIDDGKFDVCVFKPFPLICSLGLGIRLFARNINRSRYIETLRAEKVVFRKKQNYKFHIDGEPVKFRGPVKISVIQAGLKVIVPKENQKKTLNFEL
ncbi:MAG: diacylglycerol kinase family lipid kinase [Bacteroidales bacterium]|nr:diacylglycerol kinase family lipid kinase [Bacteroidales bacterium]